MNANLLHAEFDGFQVAIIVLAVIFSFVKWLWEQWRGKAKAQEIPEPAEPIKRDQQWPPPAVPSQWDELRKAWKELREVSKGQSTTPPPIPTRAQPVKQAARRDAMTRQQAPKPVLPAAPPIMAPVMSAPATVTVSKAPVSPLLASLRALRQDPVAMRRAIILNEVLGPPKALQA
jgi:hypothetical protein